MNDTFSIRKNLCFALNYLFFPVGLVLLIANKKDLTKEDRFEIVRGFVITVLMAAISIISSIVTSIATALTKIGGYGGIIFGVIFWLIAIGVFAAIIGVAVEWVLSIIGRFTNKNLKFALVKNLVDKLTSIFVK